MSRPTGFIMAPPRPCRMRKATSMGRFVAMPQSADPAVNSTIAAQITLRMPKRSAIQPEIGMKIARLRT